MAREMSLPVIVQRVKMLPAGDWRSGSAAALHAVGRGFESLIAHHVFWGPHGDNLCIFMEEANLFPTKSNLNGLRVRTRLFFTGMQQLPIGFLMDSFGRN